MKNTDDKGTLLIVDDFPANLSNLFAYLRKVGFNVNIAESGEDALEEITYSKPDIILLDVMMPGLDGYETCHHLKANKETCDIPVIFMTALIDTADKIKGFEMGAVDYIIKPIQQEEVLARVTTHITLSKLQKKFKKQAVELRQQNNELEAFAHTIAYDLKNPLNTISDLCDTFNLEGTLSSQEGQETLQTIQQFSHKTVNIIDSLLVLTNVRNQTVVMEPISIMGKIINQVQERLAHKIKEYQGEIIVPTSWPTALGYSPWIEEVWTNYISNGLKYGGLPPRLELGATEQAESGYFRFWVRDNGRGLTEEEQNQLFVPFTDMTQARIEGHGLGLSIVQRIIEKTGGKVGVESQVGQGSTFYFTLPEMNHSDSDNWEKS
ncbi:MAG: hybrid sensor histidine kinase/response regulator [Thiomargarita sp.]|nr:hybrid sensor histidine kinase/response regulator [Thiomargarita sp.]